MVLRRAPGRVRRGPPRDRRRQWYHHVPPLVQYADFASWQGELEEAGVFAARLDFWRRYLAEPPGPLTVPGSRNDTGDDIAQIPFRVDAPTAQAIRALARERGASVYVVLMAAFAVLAHRLTGADDMVLGTRPPTVRPRAWSGSSGTS
ncbi:condensation domain-containing protein [Streptomyces sp. MS1.AVA.1]|uniref:Condensation domain-containing protein n=1 Tax=Streptomyces machairae TaxID=3134109 RepID=A0ABU8UQE4_9ACTN